MKKILFIVACTFASFTSVFSTEYCDDDCKDYRFTSALTTGFVFKHDDCTFKEVYGHGAVNVITADNCYYFWQPLGIGAKVSYWRARGCTTLFKQCTLLQEVPLTFYLRVLKDFDCGLQLYASLGGGVIWAKEKSYLANITMHKGIGEVETGINYPLYHCFNITGAFRYLFPAQCQGGTKTDIGGFDLRGGFAFVF